MTLTEPTPVLTPAAEPTRRSRGRGRRVGRAIAAYSVAIAGALILAMALIWVSGGSPLDVLHALVEGSLTSTESLSQTIDEALPILIVAAGAIVAGRAGFLNVGQEGQATIGAMAATAVALHLPGPTLFALPVALVGAAAAGGAWVAPVIVLRLRRNVHEVISSLLLTFVAISVVSFAVNRTWLLQGSLPAPQSDTLPPSRRFPTIEIGGLRISSAVFVGIACVLAVAVVFGLTRWGASAKLRGANPMAAQAMGVDSQRVAATALFVSGAAAGVAGGVVLTASSFQLQPLIANGVGWSGILVALVARNRVGAIVPLALFFGALRAGGGFVETTGVPRYIVQVLQALLVIACALPPLYLELRRQAGD
jgi:ABC-type uncharacterized transport system permease subunit